ncbi:MAG TPA: aminotransferase class V-fold PLP-dependent enzyme [Chryseolinea sp.]|nr:aminotransferase class V-fold PLP-dependent enzyme [Chryseolinea sp.]
MTSQKHLFELSDDIHYLNAAYMSPLMKSVYEAGIEGMRRKLNPGNIQDDDFFTGAEVVKQKFGKLIHAPAQQIAIVPSASYGLKAAVNNIPVNNGDHAVVIGNDFPSDHYTMREWCRKNKKKLKIMDAPQLASGRGEAWNEKILNAITKDTSAIILSTIHWTDGTKFDLKKIGERCREVDAYFIADGTQSVGALPMDVSAFKIDALVCAGYKWLMGPYSIGLAYYSEAFNSGTPLEDSWMTRSNARDFTGLTTYVDEYGPGADRYNMGEFSNFIHLPMVERGLQQLEKWGVDSVQDYCNNVIQPLLAYLRAGGYWVEQDECRASHLFGFLLPAKADKKKFSQWLQKKKVIVSVRGDIIRVSPHVYNDQKDIQALIEVLEANKI